MDWISMTVRTTTEGAEAVSAMFMELGIMGAMIEDKADVAVNQRPSGFWDILGDEIAARMEDDVKVTVYIAADERAQDTVAHVRQELNRLSRMDLGFDPGKLTLEVGSVDDEDWAENWKSRYKPFRLGRHFVVKPTWEHFDAEPEDKIIEIDPGMAFGSGTHETTGMCVALLEENVRPGMTVIDVGTGTGILAIAAAKMGARDVLATDLDPMATRVATENVALNHLSDTVRTACGDLLESVDETADIVVANIIADVICMFAQPLVDHIVPGGLFICSGIIKEREQDVVNALTAADYTILETKRKGEWVAMLSRRKK